MNLLVDLQCLVEETHTAVARGNHELPLDFLGLNLAGALEVQDGFLEHVLLGVVHTETTDDVNLGRVVAIRLLVVVHSLILVLLQLVKVTHLSEDLRIRWYLGDEDIVPFESLSLHTN